MKQVITRDEVAKAIAALVSQGKRPTLNAIRAALDNRGSMTTLLRLKAEIDAAAQPVADSPEGLEAFREVWSLAVGEGRKQQEAVIEELRDNLRALASENEKLDGTAVASRTRAEQLQVANAQIAEELKQAHAALTSASTKASEALQKLSDAQASYSIDISKLQSELVAAVSKSHELELQVVRGAALLEARATADANAPKSKKGKSA